MQLTKRKLKADIDFDFTLISIITPAKAHRLCSLLNEEFGFSLRKENDIVIKDSETGESRSFLCYKFDKPVDRTCYYLIANQSDGHYLIPERKITDYFLLIEGTLPTETKKDILQQLKNLGMIQISFEEDVEELTSKENLIMV